MYLTLKEIGKACQLPSGNLSKEEKDYINALRKAA